MVKIDFKKFRGLRGNVIIVVYKGATTHKPNRWLLKFKTDNGIRRVEILRNYDFMPHEELQYLKKEISRRLGKKIYLVDIENYKIY